MTPHKLGFAANTMAIILLSRTALNIAFRIVHPYLPVISRGLEFSLSSATQLITLRVLGLMAAPFLGLPSDRYGRQRLMSLAMVVFTAASLVLATASTVLAAAIAFVMYGLAKALYDPAVLAYLGDTIPYERRGRAIGIAELSWSTAWLLGVPTFQRGPSSPRLNCSPTPICNSAARLSR